MPELGLLVLRIRQRTIKRCRCFHLFAVDADKSGVPATQPKVHHGFHEFVQNFLTAKTKDDNGNSIYLTDKLIGEPEQRIIVVGHSRGGAAAALIAAYEVDTGQVIKTASFSTSTNNLTTLEAFGHICIDMNYDWLLKK
jgi:hypothetical protein